MVRRNRTIIACPLALIILLLLTGGTQAADYVFPDTLAISVGRVLQSTLVGTGDTIVVTITVNNAEPDSLRNLYFADHLPAGFFDISTTELQLNGAGLADTSYIEESGVMDEVFSGTVPHRWVIEAPPDTLGDRICSNIMNPSSGTLQIVYTARCTTGGSYSFPSYTWAGQLAGGDQVEVFGYQDSVFITVTDVPPAVTDLATVLAGVDLFLYWTPVEHGAGIDYYVVFRDTVSGFDSSTGDSIGMTADTFYVDQAAGGIGDPGLSLYYLVRAVDPAGKKSDDSNCAGEFDKSVENNK
ncbi:hypothetical protein ACFL0G_04335 [Candidatus Zixiibacteriota bacterium]